MMRILGFWNRKDAFLPSSMPNIEEILANSKVIDLAQLPRTYLKDLEESPIGFDAVKSGKKKIAVANVEKYGKVYLIFDKKGGTIVKFS